MKWIYPPGCSPVCTVSELISTIPIDFIVPNGVIIICSHVIILPLYHHYADRSEGIELLKCLSGTFCLECVSKIKSILSIIFHAIYVAVRIQLSIPISLMMIVRILVLYRITIIKSEVRLVCHCLGLGHESMACAVYLFISLLYHVMHILITSYCVSVSVPHKYT